MKTATRRHFLQKSALLTLGTAAVTPAMASGETSAEASLKSVDQELAGVLRSYGRTREMKDDGFQRARVGESTHRLPVSHLRVEVRDQESFRRSFQALAELSDRVMVEGNKVGLARGGRYFVIENRLE